MKQKNLKHWKYVQEGREPSYTIEGKDVRLIAAYTGRFEVSMTMDVGCSLTASEIAEAATIGAHYDTTTRFAPDAEEPTREQMMAWMRRQAWVCGRDAGEVSYWGLATSNARVLMGGAPDDNARSVDAIALITRRSREEIVAEMLTL
jgi:hypothetical protein